jgi:hypothetical protein
VPNLLLCNFVNEGPNGWRYRQGRDVADKTTRCRIRRWGLNPESVGESPHLSGARGVGQILQDGFEFELDASISMCGLVLGEQR